MTATLFMKAGGWQTVVQHAKYGAKSYWYSYDYRAKLSVLGSSPPIPQGNTTSVWPAFQRPRPLFRIK